MHFQPPIKPLLYQKRTIDSQHTYKTFAKANPKHTKSLEFENLVFYDLNEDKAQLKKIHRNLLQIGKRSKTLQHIGFSLKALRLNLTKSEAIEMIKGFRQIKSLHLPCADGSSKIFQDYFFWLRQCKKLKAFHCKSQCPATFINDAPKVIDHSSRKFLRGLKRQKLTDFTSNQFFQLTQVPFNYIPKDLINLCLCAPSIIPRAKLEEKETLLGDLSRFKKLRTLEVFMPTPLKVLSILLDSIPKPSEIVYLALVIRNSECEDEEKNEDLKSLQNSLNRFNKIKKLDLKFVFKNQCLDIIKAFKSDFTPSTTKMNFLQKLVKKSNTSPLEKLREMNLFIPIDHEDQICMLNKIISKCKSLKKLKIELTGELPRNLAKSCKELFCYISKITTIEALDIHLSLRQKNELKAPETGIIAAFSQCISKLTNLKELGLIYKMGFFGLGFSSFLASLSRNAPKFKRFELKVPGVFVHPDLFTQLMQILREMSSIETLEIGGLVFEINNSLMNLFTVLKSLQRLKTLKLNDLLSKEKESNFINILLQVMTKQGFEVIEWDGMYACEKQANKSLINPLEIFQKNPELKVIRLPSTLSESFVNRLKKVLETKWTE